jgi:hypothetical protein
MQTADISEVASSTSFAEDTHLTPPQAQELSRCEHIIRKGLDTFVEVGTALLIIRDQRLYRSTHKSFEAYLGDKWEITARQANRLIGAGSVVENLKRDQLVSSQPTSIPKNEAQARPLTALSPEKQVKAAQIVAAKTDNPVTKDYEDAANEVMDEKPRVQSYDTRDEDVEDAQLVKRPVPSPAPLEFDADLTPLTDLRDLAVLAYNTFSNSTKKENVEKLLWKLKAALKDWADWQTRQINAAESTSNNSNGGSL